MRLPFCTILIASITFLSCSQAPAPRGPSQANAEGGLDYWGNRAGPKGFRTVIIDAGHGGKDPGAVSRFTGQTEKAANLDLAYRLENELKGSFRTVMLRPNDRFIDLDDRVAFANRYPNAILVSVHFNAGPASRRGPETYWWRVDSHGLATRCQRAMLSVVPHTQNAGKVRRRLRLTRNPSIPSVLLEGGYMSHPTEARQINSPAHRQKLARAIAGAIKAQAANGDAGTGPRPPFIKSPPSRPTDPAGS